MPEFDSLPCPGCHTPLPPEATGCQVCMRARTKQEIVRGYAKLRDDKARRRRRPFQILAVLIALGALGKIYLVYGDKIRTVTGKVARAVGRRIDDMRDPKNYAGKPEDAPPPNSNPADAKPAAAPGAPVPPESALRNQLFPPDSPAPSPQPAAVPTPPPASGSGPQPLDKNAWRVSGIVYDLATLDPISGAEITFLYKDRSPVTVKTDETGAYEADLPKGEGWNVNVKAPGHRRGGLLDIDPPYNVRDADERRATLEHITDGDLAPSQVGWKTSKSRVKLDLIAVPQRWSDPPQR